MWCTRSPTVHVAQPFRCSCIALYCQDVGCEADAMCVRQMPCVWGRYHLCAYAAALPLCLCVDVIIPSACTQEWCDDLMISHLTDKMAWSAWQHTSSPFFLVSIMCISANTYIVCWLSYLPVLCVISEMSHDPKYRTQLEKIASLYSLKDDRNVLHLVGCCLATKV